MKLFPPIPTAVCLFLCFLVWFHGHRQFNAGRDDADRDWILRWTSRDLADATMTLHREVAERAEERRRQLAEEEERKRAEEELAKVQVDADAAERAGDGLQRQLAALRRQLAGSETGRLSAIAAAGAAKAETTRVLAELLGESDKRAGIYAKEADERYAAGSSCERTYDKVTNRKQ
ncbi:DUF2514 family protein [Enterobacter roggenkampii]|uniref:DUF2514 family protein n=1 Tax=Enterobacter roggenkampii TaxID=1812935 RepID=UPI000BA86756|nr:DUF2514 family protein [Enterobacter roggenkampii]PAO24635.1 hypothetical protein CIW56_01525 [Enterobacter roggenkampii]